MGPGNLGWDLFAQMQKKIQMKCQKKLKKRPKWCHKIFLTLTGYYKDENEKIENKKLPQMLIFNMCEGPKKF